ncbi:putative polysaccharide biosynthesis protein [Listeria costaricensis]|uniref:putative polysaccharide biosynthesis protein n=1 Tax=Listeria costaricensis TaxID=2026604 RepID=UPI000C0874EA|nr:polysaccharide biosynthesis protein [Listeria costaricensis]
MASKLMRGTAILTFGTVLSKVLGILYIIPFYWIIGGEENAALFNYGYVPYQIFLSIATAGVPLAIAKYIARYNAIEEYAVSRKLFRSGIFLMLITGVLTFIAMYALAPILAVMQVTSNSDGFTAQDVTMVMRAVSFALIIIPVMSLFRGYFQGHYSMAPSAVSQVIEQLARIIFLLSGTYIVLHVLDGSIVTAMSIATFSAFIGAIASMLCLLYYYFKRRPYLRKQYEADKGTLHISIPALYKSIIVTAIPFIIVGVASSLYQQYDLFTFQRIMVWLGDTAKDAQDKLGVINLSAQKIVMIPGTLALSFSVALVPLVSSAFIKKQYQVVHKNLTDVLQMTLFLTLPACLGIALLAEPIYTIFYGYSAFGTDILAFYAPIAILFSLFSVTAAILQGIDEQRFTVLSLLLGLLVKSVLQMPLMSLMGTKGALMATGLGYTVSVIFTLIIIHKYAHYSFKRIGQRTIGILILNVGMLIATYLVYLLCSQFISPEHRLSSVVLLLICVPVGVFSYGYLSLKTRLFDKIFPGRGDLLRQKLRIN